MPTLKEELAVSADRVRRQVDPGTLGFTSTAEVAPLQAAVGQPRGQAAIAFALDVDAPNFHLFVSGAPGSGRESIVRDELRRVAPTRPAPLDWVYVANLDQLDQPTALSLPPGTARAFA